MAIITALAIGIISYSFNKYGNQGDQVELQGIVFIGILELITWMVIMGVIN